jgi:precorrin-4 methylase
MKHTLPRRAAIIRIAVVIFFAVALSRTFCLAADSNDKAVPGKIYLVGMGPGDAELVTIKAARILKEADRVFCFDYLKSEVERYVPSEKVTVLSPALMGRFRGQDLSTLSPQLRERAQRNEAELVQFTPKIRKLVADGKTIAFADSGDPTIYCPSTWILEEFADLHPSVIPGLSSFNAANAVLKQSITKNGASIIITPGDNLGEPDANGRLKDMLVCFTHKTKFPELLKRLQARYPADTPLAIVCEASYDRQRVIFGTLNTILCQMSDPKLPHLYLIYVGDGLTKPSTACVNPY